MAPWLTTSRNGIASIGTGDSVTDRGYARLPTTTTCSSSSTDRTASTVAVAPAPTATPRRTYVRKPGSVNVTFVRAGQETGDRERTAAIGDVDGDGERAAGLRVARLHGDAGQHESGCVGDGACDRCFLGLDDGRGRERCEQRDDDQRRRAERVTSGGHCDSLPRGQR